ncbi:MAG: 50S ribosomal protein L11 methyltransferase [Bacteroidales bacterium]
MTYIQVELRFDPENVDPETLAVLLALQNFDSFEEKPDGIIGYISDEYWNENEFLQWLSGVFAGKITCFKASPLEEKNWNEVWESNFPAVIIAGKCRVRAPFHEPDPEIFLELIIEPKMSFGTAHHETTSMMIEHQLTMDWKDKTVLDMGCGTGILAIVAAKLGAGQITAIDNDTWAYENTLENIERNGVQHCIEVKLGDAADLDGSFDIVIANINRNILLKDMPAYTRVMKAGAVLMLSGFYLEDLPAIRQRASELKLTYKKHLEKNNWIAAVFNH